MSTYASPLSNGKTSPQAFLRVLGKVFTGSGVVEPTALTVSAQVSPDMSVVVSGSALNDNAIFIHTNGHLIQAWNDANVTVTITANSSGVTKTDAIVAYVDLAAGLGGTADPANNPGALKFVAVRRAGADTGNPTSAEISTAVSSNPYLVLAYLTVANGTGVTINSGNIVNARTLAKVKSSYLEPIAGAQLSNGTTFGVSNKKLLNFVPRDFSGLTAWDYNISSGTIGTLAGGGWTNKSAQSIVGTAAVRVRLYVEWAGGDVRAILMFTKGLNSGTSPSNTDPKVQSLKSLVVNADAPNTGIIEVDLDSSQQFSTMYNAYGQAISIARANIIGWYEPASTA